MVFKILIFALLLYFIARTAGRLIRSMMVPPPEPPPVPPRPDRAPEPRRRADVEDARWVDL